MSRSRYMLVLIALFALGGAWYAIQPASPPLTAAQAVKPEEKKERPPELSRAFELAALLEKTIDYNGVEGKDVKLGEELERIQKVHKLTFAANEQAFTVEGFEDVLSTKIADPLPIPPLKASLRTVLRQVLARVPSKSGATYLIRKDHIEITTERAVRVEFRMPPAKGEERLFPMVSRQFSRKYIKGCFDEIADLTGFNVVLDFRADSEAGRDVSARFLNVPADTALRVVADMAGLKVVRMDNVFYVTTPANATKLRKEKGEPAPPKRRGIHLFGILWR